MATTGHEGLEDSTVVPDYIGKLQIIIRNLKATQEFVE